MSEENRELRLAWDFVENTGVNVFITGKAGTGKTTFLKALRQLTSKRVVVVAPTGVAAINAGGVTIHSFFQLPLSPYVPETSYKSKYDFSQEKRNIINTLDLLVIDEISMVRSDLLDAVDSVLRRYRQHNQPFGGVQLLMIGDLQQLAPVVTEQDAKLLSGHYDTPFFFGSKALMMVRYVTIELKHVYRQTDLHFVSLLNKIRDGNADDATINELNQRYIPNFRPSDSEGYIRLTTHNATAQKYNEEELEAIKRPVHSFQAKIEGNFPEYSYPTDPILNLKEGAQVMFVKNDSSPEHLFYNGKIGHVIGFVKDAIIVRCPDDEKPIWVEPMEWENARYVINEKTKEIESEVVGMFTQFPLRLAWAITIHKSQGLTFEKTIIDAGMSFASGQVYVALSRCKTLEGIVLASPLSRNAVIRDERINRYISNQEVEAAKSIQQLPWLKDEYYRSLLLTLFDFSDLYAKEEWFCRVLGEHLYKRLPELITAHRAAVKMLKDSVVTVSEKWIAVIKATPPDNLKGPAFSERISKSIAYFVDKLSIIYHDLPLTAMVDIDNKFVKTRMENASTDLMLSLFSKSGLLKLLQKNGYSVANYLKFKDVALLNAADEIKEQMSPGHKKRNKENIDVKYPKLYLRLDAWRTSRADWLDIAPSTILQQRAMINIVNALPGNLASLRSIEGVGKKTVEKYGADILQIVSDYAKKEGLALFSRRLNNSPSSKSKMGG